MAMGMELFAHNQSAYDAAIAMLSKTGKAAIIHPTGTGKSFIGFKLCADNPDKTVCWLSSSEYIFKTQIENWKQAGGAEPENIQFFTYMKLMFMTEEDFSLIGPDYIILDEFHRAGAKAWETGVRNLLDAYSDTPILGLSATSIRYLDNQRDMVYELFDGNVASEMTLGEAIVRGILAAPKYVVSLFPYQNDLENYERRIRNCRSKIVTDTAEEYLEALRRALEKADGLDVIFEKHMTDKTGKYIVFCANKEHMDKMLEYAGDWFGKIDPDMHLYSVYSSDPETSRAFDAFKRDNSDHLKLLYCIDMLNEGIHVDDISGVILFRPTVSPIVYKQQIGRALSAGKTAEPVIFDIVNNFENLYSIHAIEDEMKAAVTYYRFWGENRKVVQEHFRVIDEVRDCKALFDALNDTLSASWDLMYQLACGYYKEHGDLLPPRSYKTAGGYSLGVWLATQRNIRRGTARGHLSETQIAKLDAIGMRWETRLDLLWDRNLEHLMRYYKEKGDIDVPDKYVDEAGFALGRWISKLRVCYRSHIKNGILTPERIGFLNDLGMIWNKLDYLWERNYQAALAFYKENGHLNVSKRYRTADGIALGAWLYNILINYRRTDGNSLTEEQKQCLENIGMDFNSPNSFDEQWDDYYQRAAGYYQKHGDLAVPYYYKTEDGYALGLWIARHRTAYKRKAHASLTENRIQKLNAIGMLWDYQPPTQWDAYYPVLERYHAEHGNIDINTHTLYEGVYLGQWLVQQKNLYRKGMLSKDKILLLEKLSIDWLTRMERLWENAYARANAYFEEHGDLNVGTNNSALGSWLISQRRKYRDGSIDSEHYKRLSAIGMVWDLDDAWEASFAEAKKYFQAHGNLDIPAAYITETGMKLGRWYRSVRNAKRNGTLSAEREKRLEEIGIKWLSVKTRNWMQYYELAQQFYEEHGNLVISADYQTPDGINLGVWISSQRYAYSTGKLPQEKIKLLNALGMCWQRDDSRFDEGFAYADAYFKSYGNLNVKSTFITDDGFRLGTWVHTQRNRYKNKKLSADRIRRLEAIGMEWMPSASSWENGFAHLKAYFEENGGAAVPAGYVCGDGYKLGTWVANQKSRNRCGALPEARAKRLEALGVTWTKEYKLSRRRGSGEDNSRKLNGTAGG